VNRVHACAGVFAAALGLMLVGALLLGETLWAYPWVLAVAIGGARAMAAIDRERG
jgi:hypothetical protein